MIYQDSDRKKKSFKKSKKKARDNFDEEAEDKQKYLNIWPHSPSFKDIDVKSAILKSFSLIFLFFFVSLSVYLVNSDLFSSVGAGVVAILAFVLVFSDGVYGIRHRFSMLFKSRTKIDPFEDLIFCRLKEDPFTLYFSHKKLLTITGLQVFKVQIIPENVQATIHRFVRSLSDKNVRIPFTYQVVQKPLSSQDNAEMGEERSLTYESSRSFRTYIYFCVYSKIKGIFSRNKLNFISEELTATSNVLRTCFSANFHHYGIKQLSGTELISSLSIFTIKYSAKISDKLHDFESKEKVIIEANIHLIVFKAICLTIVVIAGSLVFLRAGYSIFFTIIADAILLLVFIFVWWKELFFMVSVKRIKKDNQMIHFNPFREITFYRIREFPNTLFFHANNEILGGIKNFNVKYAPFPLSCSPNGFYISTFKHMTNFNFTILATPLSWHDFFEEGFEYLNEKTKNQLLVSLYKASSDYVGENWLSVREGMWRVIGLLSAIFYKQVPSLALEDFYQVEQNLTKKAIALRDAFHINFRNFQLVQLENHQLISSFTCESLKTRIHLSNNSHLNYLLLQGTTLASVADISRELKKGVETQIAAEFNTPTYLENFISIGYTINMEFLEEEIPAGFTLEQVKSLLIVSGPTLSREILQMKIVAEMVKAGISSIIFDFSGNWVKLLDLFKGSRYENDFFYFKLGRSFTVNPFFSGIENDINNSDYLELAFDAYAMSFKKDRKAMESFKNIIWSNAGLDLDVLVMDIQNKSDWERNGVSDSIVSLYKNIPQEMVMFSGDPESFKTDIKVKEFLKDNKTVIVDLSASKDLEVQMFITYIIISKIIHHINNSLDFSPKVLVIPNVDLFFDNRHIDNVLKNSGKIDKFLNPLKEEGFGFVFSASQAHYLHESLFNYFSNLIAYKTGDNRDVSVLTNHMNLQELHGTGYYSSKRNTTYQINYLKTMKSDTVIVKRSDVEQPFPVRIHLSEILKASPMDYQEIVDYMKRQGCDLESLEKELLKATKKTPFEENLEEFAVFADEIARFLDALRAIHEVGNLYEKKVKEELLKFLYPKFSTIETDKKSIKRMRDRLFKILLQQEYLVEAHPKKASGAETIATSYKVGPRFKKEFDEYAKMKNSDAFNSEPEVVEKETEPKLNLKNAIGENSSRSVETKNFLALKGAITRNAGILVHGLYKTEKLVASQNYQESINMGIESFREFLSNLQDKFIKIYENNPFVEKSLDKLFDYLTRTGLFPFTNKEIHDLVEKYHSIATKKSNSKEDADTVCTSLSSFVNQILQQIHSNNNKEVEIL